MVFLFGEPCQDAFYDQKRLFITLLLSNYIIGRFFFTSYTHSYVIAHALHTFDTTHANNNTTN
ncbi:hypothetical protein CR513_28693, partial [Mucuna pruriens]